MYYLKIVRPLNLLMIAITMLLFRVCIIAASPYKIFYVQPELSNVSYVFLMLSTLFIAAGGYVINDIFDAEIDAINRQHTVIVKKHISENVAYNYYKILCLLGVIFTFLLAFFSHNFRLSMLPLIIMVILNFYAHSFKKQFFIGNFMIAISTAFVIILPMLFEAVSNDADNDMQTEIKTGIIIAGIVYGLFAFLSTLLREIVKDMEDINGDEQLGCRTIPVVLGVKKTKYIATVIAFILLIQLSVFAYFFPSIQIKNVSLVIILGLILPLIAIVVSLFFAKTASNYHNVSNLIKVFMFLGIASMLYFIGGTGPYIFMQFINFVQKYI